MRHFPQIVIPSPRSNIVTVRKHSSCLWLFTHFVFIADPAAPTFIDQKYKPQVEAALHYYNINFTVQQAQLLAQPPPGRPLHLPPLQHRRLQVRKQKNRVGSYHVLLHENVFTHVKYWTSLHPFCPFFFNVAGQRLLSAIKQADTCFLI